MKVEKAANTTPYTTPGMTANTPNYSDVVK